MTEPSEVVRFKRIISRIIAAYNKGQRPNPNSYAILPHSLRMKIWEDVPHYTPKQIFWRHWVEARQYL